MSRRMECGYCGGSVIFEPAVGYVHEDGGERVTPSGPGDLVSARHNIAGSRVMACDVVDVDDEAGEA